MCVNTYFVSSAGDKISILNVVITYKVITYNIVLAAFNPQNAFLKKNISNVSTKAFCIMY